jgi:methylmalonyl-CoA mutase, C-terminal domain
VLVTVLGLDQHEAGALALSRILRDAGIEVVYTGRYHLPESIARAAMQEDVDLVAVSCHSWEFLYYCKELVELLAEVDPPIPVAIGGSVVTANDRAHVLEQGAAVAVAPDASESEILSALIGAMTQGAQV